MERKDTQFDSLRPPQMQYINFLFLKLAMSDVGGTELLMDKEKLFYLMLKVFTRKVTQYCHELALLRSLPVQVSQEYHKKQHNTGILFLRGTQYWYYSYF